jgi:hypothetical protein
MAVSLDGPVGLRWRVQSVKNARGDQDKVINSLASIPEAQGGKKETWTVPPLSGPDGSCPKFVADAIWDFQTFWKKKGVCHVVDGVVDPGKTTLRKLNELAGGGGGGGGGTDTKLPLDIFVYFRGAPPELQGTRDTGVEAAFKQAFNTSAYLKTHQPAVPVCFLGGRAAEGKDRAAEAASEVLGLREQTRDGVTIVRGDSIGGMTALNAATILTQTGVKLSYVAIDDSAFFNDFGDIASFKPVRFRVPGPITADRKDNFFQAWGHELLNDSRGPGGFMEGTEFHGPIDGFNNQNVSMRANMMRVKVAFSLIPGSSVPSLLPLRVKIPFAGQAHEAAHKDADPLIDAVVKSLIRP